MPNLNELPFKDRINSLTRMLKLLYRQDIERAKLAIPMTDQIFGSGKTTSGLNFLSQINLHNIEPWENLSENEKRSSFFEDLKRSEYFNVIVYEADKIDDNYFIELLKAHINSQYEDYNSEKTIASEFINEYIKFLKREKSFEYLIIHFDECGAVVGKNKKFEDEIKIFIDFLDFIKKLIRSCPRILVF